MSAIHNAWYFFSPPPPVTGMKMDAIPEMLMETEDRQSTEYEVRHQKLVNKRALKATSSDYTWCVSARGARTRSHVHVLTPSSPYNPKVVATETGIHEDCGATMRASHFSKVHRPLIRAAFIYLFTHLLWVPPYLEASPWSATGSYTKHHEALTQFLLGSLIPSSIVIPAQNPQSILKFKSKSVYLIRLT